MKSRYLHISFFKPISLEKQKLILAVHSFLLMLLVIHWIQGQPWNCTNLYNQKAKNKQGLLPRPFMKKNQSPFWKRKLVNRTLKASFVKMHLIKKATCIYLPFWQEQTCSKSSSFFWSKKQFSFCQEPSMKNSSHHFDNGNRDEQNQGIFGQDGLK